MTIEEFLTKYHALSFKEHEEAIKELYVKSAKTLTDLEGSYGNLEEEEERNLTEETQSEAGTFSIEAMKRLLQDEEIYYQFNDVIVDEQEYAHDYLLSSLHPYALIELAKEDFVYSHSLRISDMYLQLKLLSAIPYEKDTTRETTFYHLINAFSRVDLLVKKAIGLSLLNGVRELTIKKNEDVSYILETLHLPEKEEDYQDEIATYLHQAEAGVIAPAIPYPVKKHPFATSYTAFQYYYVLRGEHLEEALLSPTPIRKLAIQQLLKQKGMNELFLWDTDETILSEVVKYHANPLELIDHDNPFLRAVLVKNNIGLSVLKWDTHDLVKSEANIQEVKLTKGNLMEEKIS